MEYTTLHDIHPDLGFYAYSRKKGYAQLFCYTVGEFRNFLLCGRDGITYVSQSNSLDQWDHIRPMFYTAHFKK